MWWAAVIRRAPKRIALVPAVALGICVAPIPNVPARADDAPERIPQRLRLSVALSTGAMVGLDFTADGRPVSEQGSGMPNPLVTLGVDGPVAPWLAFGVEARFGGWDSTQSQAVGYYRDYFDLDAVMRFRAPAVWLFQRPLVLSLSPSVGFTWPDPPSRDTRAVTETWRSRGDGGNAGIELACETWFALRRARWKLGAAVGVAYARHWFSLDADFTPVSDPAAAVSVRYDYAADQILFKAAFLAGF
jgi:hypothetical protein